MSFQPQQRITSTGISQSNHQEYSAEQPDATVSLGGLFSAVLKRKGLFLFPIILFLVVGAAYVYVTPPKFESTAKLLVQNKGMPLNQQTSQIRHEDEFLTTQAEVVSSYAVVSSAVKDLDVTPPEDPQVDMAMFVTESMSVIPLKDTDVLEVRYRAEKGADAQRTLDAIVESYKNFLKQDDRDVYRETLNVLTKNEKELRDEMSRQKAELTELRKASPLIGQGKDPAEVQKTMLTNLGQTVVNAKNRRIELENQVASFKAADPQVAEELLRMQKRMIPNNEDGRAHDPIGIQMTLLIDLGEAKIDATNRRIELEKQISAFKKLASSETGGRISPTAIQAIRGSFTGPRPGKARANSTNSLFTVGSQTRGGAAASHSLVGVEEPAVIRQALFQAQAREAELAQKYGDKHPLMLAVRQQIKEWQARLKETTNAALDNLDQEFDAVLAHMNKELEAARGQEELLVSLYEKEFLTAQASVIGHLQKELNAAKLHEEQLITLYDEEFTKAKKVDGFVMEEEQLRDDIVRTKTMHDTLVAQMNHWQLTSESVADVRSAVKVTVLDAPKVPVKAAWPIPWLVLGLCGVIGSCCGLGLVTAAERSASQPQSSSLTTYSNQNDTQLSVPIVAEIPSTGDEIDTVPQTVRLDRLAYERPESRVSEAYRGLRTRLEIGNRSGRSAVIQIASPTDGVDNTTVTANLAFSFAQLGRRVVVVDADLQNGDLHDIFEVPNDRGLSSVLNGATTLHDAIMTSPMEGIAVLPRGPRTTDPVRLLSQADFSSVLESLRSQFDVVLMDSSALLKEEEAAIVASHSDCILLSTVPGATSEAEIQRANELLASVGVKASGIVVCEAPAPVSNDAHPQRIAQSVNGERQS